MDPRIERTLAFVEAHLGKPVLLEDLAAEAGLSEFHFHRLFKKEVGATPGVYVNRVRLRRAAVLLVLHPQMPLIEVALELGFSSPATFTRAFQAYFEQSPSRFRRQRLANGPKATGKMKNLAMPVTYLNARRVLVQPSKVEVGVLTRGYRTLMADNPNHVSYAIGLFVDAPFHTKPEFCQHFIALDETTKHQKNSLVIEGGYFTHFTVCGDHDASFKAIDGFYRDKILPSAYKLRSTVYFEKIKIPENPADFEYVNATREVFLAIERK